MLQGGNDDASWQATHAALVELARERAGLDFEEGRLLLAARRAQVHRELGYGSFTEYADRLFGYAPRLTFEKLRVAEALDKLPELARELREGTRSFSHVRELTRVATPETEQIWLDRSRGCTSRQVEKLVSGRGPGSLPDTPADPALALHVLRYEVRGETAASFREAIAKLRSDAGEHLDDDATLLTIARSILEGPADDGRASYQMALDVCEDCKRARQLADGELIDVSAAAVEMARCDAQWIPSAHVDTTGELANERATQNVAPATRRQVLRRDHHRCQVPGCKHATFVDVHHVNTRADGGGHDADNLVTLCGAHHRAVHEGTLNIANGGENGLQFRHADGTSYGSLPLAPLALVQARAFRALRALGFNEREVREALSQVLQQQSAGAGLNESALRGRELDAVLRQSLELLTDGAWTKAS